MSSILRGDTYWLRGSSDRFGNDSNKRRPGLDRSRTEEIRAKTRLARDRNRTPDQRNTRTLSSATLISSLVIGLEPYLYTSTVTLSSVLRLESILLLVL
jgi:hypothetical protein